MSQRVDGPDQDRIIFIQPNGLTQCLEKVALAPAQEPEAKAPPTSEAVWRERIWDAMRHLDDRIALNQNSLSRLAYIERLAKREFPTKSLANGMALKKTLLVCMNKIIAAQADSPAMGQTCQFLELTKQGLNLTAISDGMGLSREQVTRHHKKKAVELVTQEFMKKAKTRKRLKNTPD